MINKIWGIFIVMGSIYCMITNQTDVLNEQIFHSAKNSLDMILQFFPVIALWLGIMNIAKQTGLLSKLSNLLSPLLRFLFPEIPKGHEAYDYISSNFIANMFGLGNAATPFGLKAMKSLQTLNEKKDTASRSMITFLLINTSGVTLIPTTVISMRMAYLSANPTEIILASLCATAIPLIFGVIIDRLITRRRA